MIRSANRFLLARVGAVVALAAIGCGKNDNYGCPTIDAQGGPTLGTWNVTGACTVAYDRVTSLDWCSQLVYDANGVRQAQLGHPPLPFKQGTITFDGGGHYMSSLTFETSSDARPTTHFSRACLNAYGLEPTCGELTDALGTYLMDQGSAIQSYRLLNSLMFVPFYPPGLAPEPSYSAFACTDNAGGDGCDCAYTVGLVVPDRGAWNADKTTILSMFSETAALPYDNDFTSTGGALSMTGHDGLDLMGQYGLRTLTLTKQ